MSRDEISKIFAFCFVSLATAAEDDDDDDDDEDEDSEGYSDNENSEEMVDEENKDFGLKSLLEEDENKKSQVNADRFHSIPSAATPTNL